MGGIEFGTITVPPSWDGLCLLALTGGNKPACLQYLHLFLDSWAAWLGEGKSVSSICMGSTTDALGSNCPGGGMGVCHHLFKAVLQESDQWCLHHPYKQLSSQID